MGQLGGVGRVVVSHSCGEQDSTVTNPLPDRPTHLFRALPVVSASFLFGHLKSKYRPNNNSSPWLSLLCLIQPNLSWTLICQLNYAVFKTDPTRLYKSFASRLYNSFAILCLLRGNGTKKSNWLASAVWCGPYFELRRAFRPNL